MTEKYKHITCSLQNITRHHYTIIVINNRLFYSKGLF